MATRGRTQPRKTPRQERSQATVEAILTATARILVAEGYDRASTNKVAMAAGVSIGSLYQYFPSKEALVAALCERHIARMLQVCQDKLVELGNAPLDVAARDLVRALLRAHAVEPKLHKVLIEQVPRIGRMRAIDGMNEKMSMLVRLYLESRRDSIRPQNLDLAVFVLVHAVEALTHAAVIERPDLLTDGELADEISELVLRYLRVS